MSDILVIRAKLQEIYANRSTYIDKALQLVLAVVSFIAINQSIGLMRAIATPFVAIALAFVCTFLPPVCTVLVAAGLILGHMASLSIGIAGVSALIFMMMFIFYCRFTPKRALILLITPITFLLHIPYVVPIVCGLLMTPIVAVPVAFGTIIYYMISYVKTSVTAISNAGGMIGEINLFVRTVFQNKEMWITILAFVICIFSVYAVKRLSIDHAWKAASAVGAVVNLIVIVVGDIVFHIPTSYLWMIAGNILAIVAGILVEFLFFAVDYSRSERIQYEDDEYYYYVKAVPKMNVAAPEKTVKKINERKNKDEEEKEEIRRKKRPAQKRQVAVKRGESTEEFLLNESLKNELDL